MKIVSKLAALAPLIIGISAAHSSIYAANFNHFCLPDVRFNASAPPSPFFNNRDVFILHNTISHICRPNDFLGAKNASVHHYWGTFSTSVSLLPTSTNSLKATPMIDGRWPAASSRLISPIAADLIAGTDVLRLTRPTHNTDHKSANAIADANSEADPSTLAMLGLGLFGFAIIRRAKRKSAK